MIKTLSDVLMFLSKNNGTIKFGRQRSPYLGTGTYMEITKFQAGYNRRKIMQEAPEVPAISTNVEFVKQCWDKMDATNRQEFLTYLQSRGVIITATETQFSGLR